jgi:hypothetical protein
MNGFVLLGVSNYSYSIALWVRPSSINGSTLVHLSTTTNGQGWCVDLMGFSSSGVWTHVVTTYSVTNAVRLYINGTLIGTTGSIGYLASGLVNILTLANPIQGGTCNSQSVVYSRELNTVDIYTFANP